MRPGWLLCGEPTAVAHSTGLLPSVSVERVVIVLAAIREIVGCRGILGILLLIVVACLVGTKCQAEGLSQFGEEVYKFEPLPDPGELLQDIEVTCLANYSQIASWEGEYTFFENIRIVDNDGSEGKQFGVNESDSTGVFRKGVQGICRFAVDTVNDQLFVDWEPQIAIIRSVPGGREVYRQMTGQPPLKRGDGRTASLLRRRRSIVTSEHWLHSVPGKEYGRFLLEPEGVRHVGPAGFRDPSGDAGNYFWRDVVDVRLFFGVQGRTTWQMIHEVATTLSSDEHPEGIDVSRSPVDGGEMLRIALTPKTGGQLEMRVKLYLDSRVQWNLTRAIVDGPAESFQEAWIWEYEDKNGVFIPSKFIKTISDSGNREFERGFDLVESELNHQIDEVTFSYGSLGLGNGDRVVDRLQEKVYVLKDGTPVEPKYGLQAVQEQPRSAVKTWVLILINAVACVIAIGLFWKSRMRKSG